MFDPKYAPNYILVTFGVEGKKYLYRTPFTHKQGDLVLVNTYGTLKVAHVYAQNTNRYLLTSYDGPISSIEGVGYLLQDLPEPSEQIQTRKSFMDYIQSWASH